MGNQCFSQCYSSSADSQNLTLTYPKSTIQSAAPPQYIDSQGNPLPNAYKRYVKPPTTVGRQSIIVRNLYENQDVPDWIWATQNQDIFTSTSGYGKKPVNHVRPLNGEKPYHDHRNTYELIQGRFQGLQTVNLSKLQNKNITNSQTNPIQNAYNSGDNKNVRYSIPPQTTFSGPSPSPLNTSTSNKTPVNPFTQQPANSPGLRRTFSINDVPVTTSINANNDNYGNNINISGIKNSQGPLPNYPQNYDANQTTSRLRVNQTIQSSGFNSNMPSVQNSIQRPW